MAMSDKELADDNCPDCHGRGWIEANPRLRGDGQVACDCVVRKRQGLTLTCDNCGRTGPDDDTLFKRIFYTDRNGAVCLDRESCHERVQQRMHAQLKKVAELRDALRRDLNGECGWDCEHHDYHEGQDTVANNVIDELTRILEA